MSRNISSFFKKCILSADGSIQKMRKVSIPLPPSTIVHYFPKHDKYQALLDSTKQPQLWFDEEYCLQLLAHLASTTTPLGADNAGAPSFNPNVAIQSVETFFTHMQTNYATWNRLILYSAILECILTDLSKEDLHLKEAFLEHRLDQRFMEACEEIHLYCDSLFATQSPEPFDIMRAFIFQSTFCRMLIISRPDLPHSRSEKWLIRVTHQLRTTQDPPMLRVCLFAVLPLLTAWLNSRQTFSCHASSSSRDPDQPKDDQTLLFLVATCVFSHNRSPKELSHLVLYACCKQTTLNWAALELPFMTSRDLSMWLYALLKSLHIADLTVALGQERKALPHFITRAYFQVFAMGLCTWFFSHYPSRERSWMLYGDNVTGYSLTLPQALNQSLIKTGRFFHAHAPETFPAYLSLVYSVQRSLPRNLLCQITGPFALLWWPHQALLHLMNVSSYLFQFELTHSAVEHLTWQELLKVSRRCSSLRAAGSGSSLIDDFLKISIYVKLNYVTHLEVHQLKRDILLAQEDGMMMDDRKNVLKETLESMLATAQSKYEHSPTKICTSDVFDWTDVSNDDLYHILKHLCLFNRLENLHMLPPLRSILLLHTILHTHPVCDIEDGPECAVLDSYLRGSLQDFDQDVNQLIHSYQSSTLHPQHSNSVIVL